ncbi:MAG: hypothetical protein EOO44_15300 [Flavobacterium sp.]|nr:MAG: hypothetical protein EOO44_15300 [Flavobacterium sp.]
MDKSLIIEILSHIHTEDNFRKDTDIIKNVNHLLEDKDGRTFVVKTLLGMREDGLVDLSNENEYHIMHWTKNGKITPYLPKFIMVKITPKGEDYLKRHTTKEQYINVSNSQGFVIGDNNHLRLSDNHNITNTPSNTPSATPNTKEGLFTKKNLWSLITAIIIAIIIAIIKGWFPFLK